MKIFFLQLYFFSTFAIIFISKVMNFKQVISVFIFLGLVILLTISVIYFRNSNSNDLNQKNLVIIGKAPSFSFTNQYGNTISNETYKGKVYVVDFFFTSCPTICPIMTHNMVKVQNAFTDNSIGIASFSIDPENDTPEVLLDYAQQHGVTNPNWHFMTGNEQDIYNLSNVGFNIYAGKGNADEEFEHSGLFALIDQQGNIISRKDEKGNPIVYYKALEKEGIEALIEDIKKLQQ